MVLHAANKDNKHQSTLRQTWYNINYNMDNPNSDNRTYTIDNIKHILKDIDKRNKILEFHYHLNHAWDAYYKKNVVLSLDLINPYPITLIYNGGELDIHHSTEFKYRRYGKKFFFSPRHFIEHVTVASSVVSLPKYIFQHCLRLKMVKFQQPSSLRIICEGAFHWCVSLNNVKIPSSVNRIEKLVFCDCLTLNNINVPNTVTSLGDSLFANNVSLSQITLPTSLITLPEYTFAYCHDMISIVIPSSVITIMDYAFLNCKYINTIALPKALEYIETAAFMDCQYLRFLHFEDSTFVDQFYRYRSSNYFRTFNKNVILLVNGINKTEGLEPILNLSSVGIMLRCVPENLPEEEQMKVLFRCFQSFFPIVAKTAGVHGMNLLHVLTQYPSYSNIHSIDMNVVSLMQRLLYKCPTAAMSVDNVGLSPLYHLLAFNSRKNQSMIQTLLNYCDNSVLNQAIKSISARWDVIKLIAILKFESLSELDEDTGLFPFMLSSQKKRRHNLTLTYELILMKPEVLLQTGIKFC